MELADRIELHELPGRYGDAIDDRDWARLGTIFTEDAVFDLTDLGEPRLKDSPRSSATWTRTPSTRARTS